MTAAVSMMNLTCEWCPNIFPTPSTVSRRGVSGWFVENLDRFEVAIININYSWINNEKRCKLLAVLKLLLKLWRLIRHAQVFTKLNFRTYLFVDSDQNRCCLAGYRQLSSKNNSFHISITSNRSLWTSNVSVNAHNDWQVLRSLLSRKLTGSQALFSCCFFVCVCIFCTLQSAITVTGVILPDTWCTALSRVIL